jgi:Mce-associated membrane protein
VATGVFAVIGVRHASHQNSLDHERTQVAALAGKYAVDFTSVDYQHLQDEVDAAVKNTTASFGPRFRTTIGTLAPFFLKEHVVQTTSVALAGLQSITPTSAVVIVALNSIATSTKSTGGVKQLFRVQISLKKVGSRWLTDNVALQ